MRQGNPRNVWPWGRWSFSLRIFFSAGGGCRSGSGKKPIGPSVAEINESRFVGYTGVLHSTPACGPMLSIRKARLPCAVALLWAVTLPDWMGGQLSAWQDTPFSDAQIEFFENEIRPVLVEHCLECHGSEPDSIRGGLRLTSRPAMLEGGDSGPLLVPGRPEDSLLLEALRHETYEMPPQGMLAPEIIARFEQWISMGAPDPRTEEPSQPVVSPPDVEAGRRFWSFQPLAAVDPPGDLSEHPWTRTPIDAFLLQRLQSAGLEPSPDAERATLLRRVCLALTGLPPDPETVRQFCTSQRPLDEDLAELVDGLLESPQYGERWGRHWLDVVRFAESSGGGRSLMFPDAWRFRDYVIHSFNVDKPFDRFVREQIAGDLLPADSHEQRSEQIVATGFLVLGPTNYEQQDKQLLQMDVVDEQIDTIGRAFMGMTLGCARCHDHKFDPVPTADYYALAGILNNTVSLVDGNVSGYVHRSIATAAENRMEQQYREQVTRLTAELEAARGEIARLGGQIAGSPGNRGIPLQQVAGIVLDNTQAELTGMWKDSVHQPGFVGAGYIHDDKQPRGANSARFAPVLERGGRYEVRISWTAGGNRASNVPVTIDHQDGRSEQRVNQSQTPPLDGMFGSLGVWRFEADAVAAVTISNRDTDGVVIVDAIQFLPVDDSDDAAPRSSLAGSGGPADAADEQPVPASPELVQARRTAAGLDARLKQLKRDAPRPLDRAMSVEERTRPVDGHIHIRGHVRNRGPRVPRGFVSVAGWSGQPEIPADSGGRGELADWIASPRHPLTARVYVNRVWQHLLGAGLVRTPDNFGAMGQPPTHPELLDWLAAEFVRQGWSTKHLIRQIVLSRVFRMAATEDPLASRIDPENRLWWRGSRRRVDAEVLRDSMLYVSGQLDPAMGGLTIRQLEQYDLGYEFDTVRRSVYVPAFRNSMLDLFEVFDMANPNLVTGRRTRSTLPTQALFLMNSPWVAEQARQAARRLLDQAGMDEINRIETAWLQVLGRWPTDRERQLTRELLASHGKDDLTAWSEVFHGLFASLDFRHIN